MLHVMDYGTRLEKKSWKSSHGGKRDKVVVYVAEQENASTVDTKPSCHEHGDSLEGLWRLFCLHDTLRPHVWLWILSGERYVSDEVRDAFGSLALCRKSQECQS